MIRQTPCFTLTATLFPYTTLFRAIDLGIPPAFLTRFVQIADGADGLRESHGETAFHRNLRYVRLHVGTHLQFADFRVGKNREMHTPRDRKSTRLNSSPSCASRMQSSA